MAKKWRCLICYTEFDTKADALYHVTHRPIDHEVEWGRDKRTGKRRAEQYIERIPKDELRSE